MRLAWLFLAACTTPSSGFAIDRVEPASGANDAPVAIQVGGTFHLPVTSSLDHDGSEVGRVAVTVGDTELADAAWQSESSITGTVPAGLAVGPYDVNVVLGARTEVLPAGYTVVGPGGDVAPPFALSGEHWLLPCVQNSNPNPTACTCEGGVVSHTRVVGGQAGEHWHVTARIRGVVEYMGYTGGVAAVGNWYVGGVPGDAANNFYRLTVSSPPGVYYINSGVPTQANSWSIDYLAKLDLDAGAQLTFEASGQDGIQWEGVDPTDTPIVVPGIPDPPQPYNGQWAQIDVVAADPF